MDLNRYSRIKNVIYNDKSKYLKSINYILTLIKATICFYAFFGIINAFHLNDFGLLPLHCMLAFGFNDIAFFSDKPVLPSKCS